MQFKKNNTASNVLVGISREKFYSILKERNSQYIPKDFLSLLTKVRKENMCEKLKDSIASLYTNAT